MVRVTLNRTGRDQGSVAIVVVTTAVAWGLVMILAVGPLVRHLADQQRAQSAADAAALAAVLDGCDAAASLTIANGARLTTCERSSAADGVGYTARVTVVAGEQVASARATNGP